LSGAVRVIGVDESGKGDFFGPLVIAALLASDADHDRLRSIGARDSKLVADSRALAIDALLREEFPHAVLVVTPSEYNRRYQQIKNLNKLLAAGHAEVIDRLSLQSPADLAISDKFGKSELIESELAVRGQSIPLRQLTGGEAILQVAAASILARAEFIRQMDAMSHQWTINFPKGAAAQVDEAGRIFVRTHGAAKLGEVAKLHFKNYQRVVQAPLHRR
jgi:ribonuclease HIII